MKDDDEEEEQNEAENEEQEEEQNEGEHKNQFLSTAPIKICYGNSTYNKRFMGIKETKQELKEYSQ